MPEPLVIDRSVPGVLALWLDRPAKRNALDRALVEALAGALERVDERAVVLGTTDGRAFCAGVDLDTPADARARLSDDLYGLYRQMVALPVPVVAALEGPAVGGGAQLAVAADIRIAAPSAVLRFAGPGHGLAVGAWALGSLVGRGRAMDLCLSMRPVAADEALGLGLLEQVAERPREVALALAAGFAALDAGAVARVKDIVRDRAGLLAGLDAEREGNRRAWSGSIEGLGFTRGAPG